MQYSEEQSVVVERQSRSNDPSTDGHSPQMDQHTLIQSILDQSAAGIVVHDSAMKCLIWNPFMERVSGIPNASAMGGNMAASSPLLSNANAVADCAKALAGETIMVHDLPSALDVNGTSIFLSIRHSPLLDNSGRVIGVITTLNDTTVRRRVQVEATDSEEMFHHFFDSGPIGMAIINPELKFTRINRRLCEILGYSEADLKSKSLKDLIHPDDFALEIDRFERLVRRNAETSRVDLRFIREDGQSLWLSMTELLLNPETPQASQRIATFEDVSGRKSAEEESLRIIEGARCIIWHSIVRDTGHPVYYDWETTYPSLDAAQRFLRIAIPEGMPYARAFYLARSEADRKRCDYNAQHAIREGHSYDQEFSVHGADGQIHYMRESILVEVVIPHKKWRLVGVCTDITELKKTAELQDYIIQRARCLLWYATIYETEYPDQLHWEMSFPLEQATRRFLPLQIPEGLDYGAAFYIARNAEDRASIDNWISETVREDRGYEHEFRVTDADGIERWLHEAVEIDVIEPGKVWRGVGVCTDITELKRVEAEFQAYEKRLRYALEDTKIGVWEWNCVTRTVLLAHNVLPLLGYEDHDATLSYSFWMAAIHPDDKDGVTVHSLQIIDGVINTPKEFRILHRSGKWIWIHTEYKIEERDEEGHAIRLVGTLVDITDIKEAEMAVLESEQRFRALVDELPIAVWMFNSEGVMELANKAWERSSGVDASALSTFDFAAVIHADDRESAMQDFNERFAARKPLQAEFRILNATGEYRNMINIGVPRFLSNDEFVGYIGASIDVTEQKQLREQLIEAQKLESLGRLAGGVAHDFNNLLTAIMGYTELAISTLPEDAEQLPMLAAVQSAADRSANLTRQLLMYARRQMVDFDSVDMNKVILGMDSLLRRTIGEQYELVMMLTEEECSVNTNSSQMEQVLLNLVINARDAMPGGGRILIETSNVTLDDEHSTRHVNVPFGDYVLFSVTDHGQGMSAEIRERIFEPFFTTKEMGKGTGLGLAICYGIVKQSRGNIWVSTEIGTGTTFKVYLPRVRMEPSQPESQAANPMPHGSETILVVDDEPLVRDTTARILRNQGYQIMEASNGHEAISIFESSSEQIDMLLTDVVMPLMGGKELAQKLQSINPELIVLFTSGYTQDSIVQDGVVNKGIDLLLKPFTSSALAQKVAEVLSRQ